MSSAFKSIFTFDYLDNIKKSIYKIINGVDDELAEEENILCIMEKGFYCEQVFKYKIERKIINTLKPNSLNSFDIYNLDKLETGFSHYS